MAKTNSNNNVLLTADEISELFSFMKYHDIRKFLVSDESLLELIEKEMTTEVEILKKLKGYKLKLKQKGNHWTDGDNVLYTLKFKSPAKKVTELSILMNYVRGFRYDDGNEYV